MSSYENYHATNRIRCMVAGNSGSGKSTLLASLANAGYLVRVVDLDIGLDILDSYLTPEGRKNIHYESIPLSDAQAWMKSTNLTIHWKTAKEDLGRVDTWDERHVLAIDSASFWSDTVEADVLLKKGVTINDPSYNISYRNVMNDYVENQVARLCSLRCNIVLNTHLKELEYKSGPARIMPAFFGKYLPDRLPKYFNDIYLLEDHKLRTRSTAAYAFVKCSAPQAVQELEEPNLATLFQKIVAYRNRDKK